MELLNPRIALVGAMEALILFCVKLMLAISPSLDVLAARLSVGTVTLFQKETKLTLRK